ncbi:MAG: hypothetical protein JW839_21735, partial [Candidatus Lokiarchaeota archaeon]|nr:hypothetical protein [Candidatus Lokiarchaeota archaeon]
AKPEPKEVPKPEAKPEVKAVPKPEARPDVKRVAPDTKKDEAKPTTGKAPTKASDALTLEFANVDDKVDIKVVEAKLIEIFTKHDNYIPSKTDVYNEMKELGFTMLQIELAFDNLRRAEKIMYNAGVPRGWNLRKD